MIATSQPKKIKILCVDDEESILQSLNRFLRLYDYDVYTALSGAEGLAFLEKNTVDLIIVDQRMPVMSGSEFLRRVRRDFGEIISIMLSGQSDFENLITAVNDGEIFRFVSKPWDNESLLKIVRAAIARNRILSLGKRFINGEREIPTKEGIVRIQMEQDDTGIHIRVLDSPLELTRNHLTVILTALLDSLGVQQEEKVKILSGAITKENGTIIIEIEIASGMIINLQLP